MKTLIASILLCSSLAFAQYEPPPLPDNACQETGGNLASINGKITAIDTGNVTVSNFPATQAVTGTFWQATQPVSGTFYQATQPVSISAAIHTIADAGTNVIGHVIVDSAPAPTGGATSANQTSELTKLDTLHSDLALVPISASALPLPSGASTSANQTSELTKLDTLHSDLASVPVTGTFYQATQPVSIASAIHVIADAGTNVIGHTIVDSSALPTGAATSSAQATASTKLDTINTTLGSPFQAGASIGNTSFAATQATGSNLHTVVDTIPTISFSSPQHIINDSGTAVLASQNGAWNITNISGTVSIPTGASTAAKQPALGTAGSASSDVISVQGISGMTPVDVYTKSITSATTSITTTGTNSLSTIGMGCVKVNIGGTWSGNIQFEETIDGSTWFSANGVDLVLLTNQVPSQATANGTFAFDVAGYTQFRLRGNTVTNTALTQVSASPNQCVNTATLSNTYVNQSGTWSTRLQDGAGSAVNKGQAAAASSLPVTLSNENVNDLSFTGQSAQTATVNNIIPTSSGASATDATGYRSGSIQVVSTGTGGTFIFEGSNDNSNFQTIPVWSQLILTGTPITAAITPTSSNLIYTFPIPFRYLRLRIATTITGGSIQAFTKLSQQAFAPGILQVAQATAGNLNVAVGSGTVTTVSTVTTLANGQTAHSSASTGSPMRVGGRVNTSVDTTLVAGDASDLFVSSGGQLIEKPYAVPEVDWQATSGLTALAGTGSTALKAAGAAGVRNYLTACQMANTSATVTTTVSILDGPTVIWAFNLPANTAALPQDNAIITFPTPLRGTAASQMSLQLGTNLAAVYWNCQGYQAP